MIRKYAEIFCWKNVSSFCSAKATHIFSAKNIRILFIESAKTVNEMTLNELVKLTTLWTTGPWFWCKWPSWVDASLNLNSSSSAWNVKVYFLGKVGKISVFRLLTLPVEWLRLSKQCFQQTGPWRNKILSVSGLIHQKIKADWENYLIHSCQIWHMKSQKLMVYTLNNWVILWGKWHYENAYSNILKILPPKKNKNFKIKKSDSFHSSIQNIDCRYSFFRTTSTGRF